MKKISFLKKNLFLHLMFLLLGRYVLASSEQFLPMPIVNRDSHFLKLNISDFKVDSTANLVKHEFLGSIFWERSSEKILLPFLKIRLKNAKPDHVNLHFRYKDVTYLPQVIGSDVAVDIDFSIFEPSKIEVFEDGKRVGEVGVHVLAAGKKNTILLDYSCSGYNVQVSGFENEFMSVGCEIHREKSNGEISTLLKVNWISSEYKTIDNQHGPYVIFFSEGRESKFQVVNDQGDIKNIVFKVSFPSRLHKIRTSIGLGPYYFSSGNAASSSSQQLVPSIMLYGNYFLNNIHSFKFFEAMVARDSFFNHAGLYIGSEIAKFYDDRLVLSTLIGLQALTFKNHKVDDNFFTQMIYPQGGELTFHHPFGLENYKFTLGGFLSPQRDVVYKNFWTRFGSKTFIEFNFIDWKYGTRRASMFGLSVGFPLGHFL